MYVIVDPGVGVYVSGFYWSGEAEFSWDKNKALKFKTKEEAEELARSNVILGVVIVRI